MITDSDILDMAERIHYGINDKDVYGYYITSNNFPEVVVWSEDEATIKENKDVIEESYRDMIIGADESSATPFEDWEEQLAVMDCFVADWESDTLYDGSDYNDLYVIPKDDTWKVISKVNIIEEIDMGR